MDRSTTDLNESNLFEIDRTPIRFPDLVALSGVTEQVELRGPVGFCAYHGGNLERHTELVAREAAERSGASLYTVTQPPGMRRHIPSARVGHHPTDALRSFLHHCEVVITVHGYGRWGYFDTLLCGGANRRLAGFVASHIRAVLPGYETIDDIDAIPAGLRGLHPTNPCNLPRGGGMQLELPPRVRGLSPAARLRPRPANGLFPHLDLLCHGLARAAERWPNWPD